MMRWKSNRCIVRAGPARGAAPGALLGVLTMLGFVLVAACIGPSVSQETTATGSGVAQADSGSSMPPLTPDDFLPAQRGWSLVWSDEFNGDRLDRSKWLPEVSCWGGGNEERQCYTDRETNIQVANGVLRIAALSETWTGPNLPPEQRENSNELRTQDFTSGKVRTRGLADWRYGRFSARMRLTRGQGTWPAFWMMPSEDFYGAWPLSGEIDILEAVNLDARCRDCGADGRERRIQGALHFGSRWPANRFLVQQATLSDGASPADGYHVYTVEWGEGRIDWYVDDLHYFRLTSDDWYTDSPQAADNRSAPFDRRFYLMLNLAVGGRLADQNNERGVNIQAFPAELLVDWVRVYECEADPRLGRACMSGDSRAFRN